MDRRRAVFVAEDDNSNSLRHIVSTRPLVPQGSRRDPTKVLGSMKSDLPVTVNSTEDKTADSQCGPNSNSGKQSRNNVKQTSWSTLFWKRKVRNNDEDAAPAQDFTGLIYFFVWLRIYV